MLAAFVRSISPVSAELSGSVRLAAELPRQIANAHAVQRRQHHPLACIYGMFARLIIWLLPKRSATSLAGGMPIYLDPVYLDTPALAIDRVRLEICRLAQLPQLERWTFGFSGT